MLPHSIASFRRLRAADRRILLRALVLLPTLELLLHTIGFRRSLKLLKRMGNNKASLSTKDWNPRAWHIMRLTRLAARRGWVHGNCLSQSLTLWTLLQSAGMESKLRIGVRKDRERLCAHAWIEMANFPLNDPLAANRQYTMFETAALPDGIDWA